MLFCCAGVGFGVQLQQSADPRVRLQTPPSPSAMCGSRADPLEWKCVTAVVQTAGKALLSTGPAWTAPPPPRLLSGRRAVPPT